LVVKTYNRKLIPFAQQMRQEMTRAEARLWFELLRDFTPRVRRQRPFGRFIADFYCAACNVVIEVDGGQHFSPEGLVADAKRTAFLEGLGLRVVRFSNVDVLENLSGVGERLLEVLKEPESLNHD
jgi:very-short-patch-repair endonuclease